jgi:hypothetical protein
MRTTTTLFGALLASAAFAGPASAAAPAVWGGCGGRVELAKPAKLAHCGGDVSYSLYVDRLQWATFGGEQATGIGSAFINDCAVSCEYGSWRESGTAAVTLSRPRACGDRRLYTRGTIQLDQPYQGRTVFEESYPCTLVVRQCAGKVHRGALRNMAQRATTCGKARALVGRWATASGYARHRPRRVTRIGAYRCRRVAMKHHTAVITCRASSSRYVQFRAIRS